MNASALQDQWPFCRVELGLSRAEFDRLTPRTFMEMVELWKKREERLDRRTARICLAISLTIPRKEGTPLPNEDTFMPRVATVPQRVELTDEEIYEKFTALTNGPDNGKA